MWHETDLQKFCLHFIVTIGGLLAMQWGEVKKQRENCLKIWFQWENFTFDEIKFGGYWNVVKFECRSQDMELQLKDVLNKKVIHEKNSVCRTFRIQKQIFLCQCLHVWRRCEMDLKNLCFGRIEKMFNNLKIWMKKMLIDKFLCICLIVFCDSLIAHVLRSKN
jgi:hypothetical protein